MAVSEVAQLRDRIANEYMAAQWGLTGLAYGIPKHQFVTARMENMDRNCKALEDMVGSEQTTILFIETLAALPEQPERSAVLKVLQHFLGNTEETEHLLDYIQELWETIDLLVQRFGHEDARKIMHAPGVGFVDGTVSYEERNLS